MAGNGTARALQAQLRGFATAVRKPPQVASSCVGASAVESVMTHVDRDRAVAEYTVGSRQLAGLKARYPGWTCP